MARSRSHTALPSQTGNVCAVRRSCVCVCVPFHFQLAEVGCGLCTVQGAIPYFHSVAESERERVSGCRKEEGYDEGKKEMYREKEKRVS